MTRSPQVKRAPLRNPFTEGHVWSTSHLPDNLVLREELSEVQLHR